MDGSVLYELLGKINQPTFEGYLASLVVVILLVNLAKDQLGVHGKAVLLASLVSSLVVAAMKYVGPMAFSEFSFGDWLGLGIFYSISAAAVWSGLVKLPAHKFKGTQPKAVVAAKKNGKLMKPLGAGTRRVD